MTNSITIKEILKKSLMDKHQVWVYEYGENQAYEKILKFFETESDFNQMISQTDFDEIFEKPEINYKSDEEFDKNESGDILHGSEYTDYEKEGFDPEQITFSNWLNKEELRNKLVNDNIYKKHLPIN